MMTEKDFFDFAYDEYNAESALANSLLQRAAILLPTFVVVAGASISMGSMESVRQLRDRWDCLIANLALFLVLISLIIGIIFMFLSGLPRDYPKLGKLFFWWKWREDYRIILANDDPQDHERNANALSEATLVQILTNVVDAQTTAAYLNQKRMSALHKSIWSLAIAIAFLLIQGALTLAVELDTASCSAIVSGTRTMQCDP